MSYETRAPLKQRKSKVSLNTKEVSEISFREEQKYNAPIPVRAACILGILGFSLFVIPDHFLAGGSIAPLLTARGFIVGGNLLVLLMTFTPIGKRTITAMAVSSCLIMGFGVVSLTMMTGGASSRYHEALLLVFMGFSLLIPWPPIVAGVTFSLITASYGLALVWYGVTDPKPLWIVNNFILWSGVVIATTGVLIADRLRRREFEHRGSLFKTNQELAEALEKLREFDRQKTRFFANVSHELRTPLMLIMAPLEAIISGDAESHSPQTFKSMLSNVRRLLRQVNMLLEAARLETGRLRLNLNKGDPGAVLRALVGSAEPHAAARSIELQSEGLNDIPMVRFDHEKIEVAAANLISNALKFTDPGDRVVVKGSATDTHIIFEVEDTGPGIDLEMQNKIFERFSHIDSDRSGYREGSGLGLSLAKELMEIHQGTITVKSAPGEGATFVLRWPREPVEPKEERRRRYRRKEDKLAAMRLESLTARELDIQGKYSTLLADVQAPVLIENGEEVFTSADLAEQPVSADLAEQPAVLFAEDNVDLRVFVSQALGKKYRIFAVSNGREALDAALKQKPDIIMTDIMMPEMDGLTLCRHLKSDPATAKIPVILITAKTGVDAVIEGLEEGADDYIAKPFNIRELSARINAHLRSKKLQNAIDERESRLAAIGEMTTSIVHDLRGPLTCILGYTQMAQTVFEKRKNYEDADDYLETVIEQSKRLKQMLQEIMEFTGRGHTRMQIKPMPFKEYLQKVVQPLIPDKAADDLDLLFDLDLESELTVNIDPSQMQRVFENLLFNAREALAGYFSKETDEKAMVKVSVHREKDHVIIMFCDNGPGIPEDKIESIFEPFVSGTHHKGTGLGLATARNIVRAHGGDIKVIRKCDIGGAAFEIKLPLNVAEHVKA